MTKICDSEKHIESDLSKSSIDTHYSSEILFDCSDVLSSKDLALSSLDYLEQEDDALSDSDSSYMWYNPNVLIISCRED